ncbi:hypothetical protein DFJ74DRAFT_723046 [Hyaloraphidium curvatum]|nr:hypothetical protein DFJ74DRAFT_723046 [Hyaloraphidium curvatum]
MLVLPPLFARWKLRFTPTPKADGEPDIVVRWCQLADELKEADPTAVVWWEAQGGDTCPPATRLLDHDPADALCPCSRGTCAGSTLRNVTGFAYVDASARVVTVTAAVFLYSWTIAFTFRDVAMSTWWGICSLVAMYATVEVGVSLVNILGTRFRASLGTLELSRRVHHRAVWMCLRSLLDRFKAELADPAHPLPPRGAAPAP